MSLQRAAPQSQLGFTQLIYALQAIPVLIALFTDRTVVRGFLFTLPSIIGVIIAYARRPSVRGTFLESHHRWLIHTFWGALAGYLLLWLVTLPLTLVLIGIPLYYLGLLALAAWIIYRLARGWLALHDRRPV